MGLHETSTILLIDIIAQYYNVIKCHTVKFVILNIMLHHGRRNDVKKVGVVCGVASGPRIIYQKAGNYA